MQNLQANFKAQVSNLQNEVDFLSKTKTRFPKFLDKPELYGINQHKLENIPKLKKQVYDQKAINLSGYYKAKAESMQEQMKALNEQIQQKTGTITYLTGQRDELEKKYKISEDNCAALRREL